jgi:hypothetical protein
MKKRSRSILVIIGILLIVSVACNLPFNLLKNDKNSTNGESEATSQQLLPNIDNPLANDPNPNPVSFQEGLGSLDSYKFDIHILSSDSTGSITGIDEFMESSVIDENNHSIMTATSRSPEDSEESVSTSETFNLGTVTCTYSDDEWTYEKKSLQDKELGDIFSQMIDFVPVIKNPEFVGEEDLNGVKTHHFTFKISGIGEKSGAVATVNEGDYWLAVDGQYIVRYTLNLQVQSAPEGNSEAKTSILEVSYELYDVNVPIILTQPEECVESFD